MCVRFYICVVCDCVSVSVCVFLRLCCLCLCLCVACVCVCLRVCVCVCVCVRAYVFLCEPVDQGFPDVRVTAYVFANVRLPCAPLIVRGCGTGR